MEPVIEKLHGGHEIQSSRLDQLMRLLIPVYMAGFMHEKGLDSKKLLRCYEDLKAHISSAQRTELAFSPEGSLRGFACSSLVETPYGKLYHLEGIIIHPDFHNQGVGTRLLIAELKATEADFMAFHTQSRRMCSLARKVADISAVCTSLMAPYIPHRHLNEEVDVARYGGQALYGDALRLREIAVEGIDVERGDALFQAGRVKNEFRS